MLDVENHLVSIDYARAYNTESKEGALTSLPVVWELAGTGLMGTRRHSDNLQPRLSTTLDSQTYSELAWKTSVGCPCSELWRTLLHRRGSKDRRWQWQYQDHCQVSLHSHCHSTTAESRLLKTETWCPLLSPFQALTVTMFSGFCNPNFITRSTNFHTPCLYRGWGPREASNRNTNSWLLSLSRNQRMTPAFLPEIHLPYLPSCPDLHPNRPARSQWKTT